MPDSVPPVPSEPRYVRLPAWLAVVLVVLISGGLVWGAWKIMGGGEKPVDPSQYVTNDVGRGGFGPPRPLPETVTLNPNGNGIARTAGLSVRFVEDRNGKPAVMATGVMPRNLAIEDRQAVFARLAAINSPANRQAAAVTDAQTARLRQIRLPDVPQMTPATRAQLLALWAKERVADAAGRSAIEKDILDTLRQTTAADIAADAKAYHAAADAIRGVLTPDQMTRLRQLRPATRPAPVRPATGPTTRRIV